MNVKNCNEIVERNMSLLKIENMPRSTSPVSVNALMPNGVVRRVQVLHAEKLIARWNMNGVRCTGRVVVTKKDERPKFIFTSEVLKKKYMTEYVPMRTTYDDRTHEAKHQRALESSRNWYYQNRG